MKKTLALFLVFITGLAVMIAAVPPIMASANNKVFSNLQFIGCADYFYSSGNCLGGDRGVSHPNGKGKPYYDTAYSNVNFNDIEISLEGYTLLGWADVTSTSVFSAMLDFSDYTGLFLGLKTYVPTGFEFPQFDFFDPVTATASKYCRLTPIWEVYTPVENTPDEPVPQPDYDYSFVFTSETPEFIVPVGVTAIFIHIEVENCGYALLYNGEFDFYISDCTRATDTFRFVISEGDIVSVISNNFITGTSFFHAEIFGYQGTEITEETITPPPAVLKIKDGYTFVEKMGDCLVVAPPAIVPQGVTKLYFAFNGYGDISFKLLRNGLQVSLYEFSNSEGTDQIFTYNVTEGDVISLEVVSGDDFSLRAFLSESALDNALTPDPTPDPIPEPDPTPEPAPADDKNIIDTIGAWFKGLGENNSSYGGGAIILVGLIIGGVLIFRKRK